MDHQLDIQPQLLRKMTVRRILETIQEQGPSSRADLTRISGISAPTVSKAVASLIESGLLEEGPAPKAALGRPGRQLRLATEGSQVIGIVLDAGQCTVIAGQLDGELHEGRERVFDTPDDYKALLDALEDHTRELIQTKDVKTLGVGISTPGLINQRRDIVELSPNLHITDQQSPSQDLQQRLDVTCAMFQETHALCLSEGVFGGAKHKDNFAIMDITTGLGLGVMSSSQLLRGHSGFAGELGHLQVQPNGRKCGCGNSGCLETVATDAAFATLISEKVGRKIDINEALRLIHNDEINAEEELRFTSDFLSVAISAAISLFNPSALYVHGRLFQAAPNLFEKTVEQAKTRTPGPSFNDCEVMQANGSKKQGAVTGMIYHLTDALGPAVA